jgi:hypothetical protein
VVLSREERARLLAGDTSALKRKQPDCEEGERHVLIWSRARTVVVDRSTGETASYPRRPLFWVEAAKPIRHRDGTWRIPLRAHDERSRPRFLDRAGTPGVSEDAHTPESERGYRNTAVGAIDELEALSDEQLKPLQAKADARWAEHREGMAADEEARRQERAIRERLKSAVRELEPLAAQALLASIERDIRAALEDQ